MALDTMTIRTPVVQHAGRPVTRGDEGLPPWLESWFEQRATHFDELHLVCSSCGLDVDRSDLVPVSR